MELKVWVEGIQRIICGVTEATTCQDVVFALAHATGKIGRFTLIERWRNNERLLAPQENPLKILMKWGEYSNDVQFVLQRSDQQVQKIVPPKAQANATNATQSALIPPPFDRTKEIRKSLNRIGSQSPESKFENIGIVKGIPQKPSPIAQTNAVLNTHPATVSETNSAPSPDLSNLNIGQVEFNSSDVRQALETGTSFSSANSISNENLLLDVINDINNQNLSSGLFKNGPPISSNGALVPPPYRAPPPPRSSPLQTKSSDGRLSASQKNDDSKDLMNSPSAMLQEGNETIALTAQYHDLVQLITYQRERINAQQVDLTKFDAEIIYLESREREQIQQLNAINQEISKTDQKIRHSGDQLQSLQYTDEENELVCQQEKTLKSEITLLRSKLANCETELLQCKNKVQFLIDEIQVEKRALSRRPDNRQNIEHHFLSEVERIQTEIDQAIQSSESSSKATDILKREVATIEKAISEKKKQVEQLVNEMKEVNLKSLAITPSEEIRNLLEGSQRLGSARRIIGSPRQLETAVPTSKNPHGVWV